jgi:hypothetical protein
MLALRELGSPGGGGAAPLLRPATTGEGFMHKRLVFFVALLGLAGALAFAGTTRAAIDGVTGQIQLLASPPAGVLFPPHPTESTACPAAGACLASDTTMFAFDEQQCVPAPTSLPVDITQPGTYDDSSLLTPGTIAAGTLVSSQFVQSEQATPAAGPAIQFDGTVHTDAPIIGIAILGKTLDKTDVLGAPGTLYPTGVFGRGLNLDTQSDFVIEQVDAQTVEIHSQVNFHADQVRIITGCAPNLFGVLSGEKYYDVNHNGQLDPGEPGIANWPIDWSDGTSGTIYTDANGQFSAQFAPDTYTLTEQQATNSAWTQTGNTVDQTSNSGGDTSALSSFAYTVGVVAGGSTSGLNFGNVCTVQNVGGLTLGWWTNKNGQAVLGGNDPAWRSVVDGYYLVDGSGARFTVSMTASFATAYSALKKWLSNATATNASYMLSAQYITTALDIEFAGMIDFYVQDPVHGDWVDLLTLIQRASAFVQANPNTKKSGTTRNNAIAYETLFDNLNNNQATVTPPTPSGCPAPF